MLRVSEDRCISNKALLEQNFFAYLATEAMLIDESKLLRGLPGCKNVFAEFLCDREIDLETPSIRLFSSICKETYFCHDNNFVPRKVEFFDGVTQYDFR